MAKILEINTENENLLCDVGKALSSPTRISILKLLYYNSLYVGEIAQKLDIPPSSAALHIRMLEDAELINTEWRPGIRGSKKLCSRKNDMLTIQLAGMPHDIEQIKTISMPVGAYTGCSVFPTCGIAGETGIIGYEDRPSDFFLPDRFKAQLVWSSRGYVEYKFPHLLDHGVALKRMNLSFEACSEAPNYRENWKSDITVWINGIECATWQSPGDFGSRRGRLNPAWWENGSTQYGWLITIEITDEGTMLNSQSATLTCIKDLHLTRSPVITLRIGNKETAAYQGGFNIFGEKFGDYAQNILLSFIY